MAEASLCEGTNITLGKNTYKDKKKNPTLFHAAMLSHVIGTCMSVQLQQLESAALLLKDGVTT